MTDLQRHGVAWEFAGDEYRIVLVKELQAAFERLAARQRAAKCTWSLENAVEWRGYPLRPTYHGSFVVLEIDDREVHQTERFEVYDALRAALRWIDQQLAPAATGPALEPPA